MPNDRGLENAVDSFNEAKFEEYASQAFPHPTFGAYRGAYLLGARRAWIDATAAHPAAPVDVEREAEAGDVALYAELDGAINGLIGMATVAGNHSALSAYMKKTETVLEELRRRWRLE